MTESSRRQFLSAGLMLPVAGAASRLGLLQGSGAAGIVSASPSGAPKLAYRTLGKTGLKVTTVGFGCMITSDPSVIARAVDLGVNFFDTARTYQQGNNERMVGTALGAKRKQIVLSSKSHSLDKASLLKDLDTSLSELKTDYVDIWYLHGKSKPDDVHDDMIEAQQIALQQGKIRFRGLSTHFGQQTLAPWIVQKGVFDVVLTAYNFTMDASMNQAIETLANAGIGIVGMKVMAGGFRGSGHGMPATPQTQREGAMLSALKWVLNKPYVATTIPSMTDMDQLDENLRAMADPFSPADGKILAAHLETIRPLYCNMCGDCNGDCAHGLPVADMLRILSYADGYRQFGLARERFRELPAHQTAVRCADCAECTVKCPHGVHVADRLTRAQDLFA
jgi:predicted aldo/keto reductase-like oxidoreductase